MLTSEARRIWITTDQGDDTDGSFRDARYPRHWLNLYGVVNYGCFVQPETRDMHSRKTWTKHIKRFVSLGHPSVPSICLRKTHCPIPTASQVGPLVLHRPHRRRRVLTSQHQRDPSIHRSPDRDGLGSDRSVIYLFPVSLLLTRPPRNGFIGHTQRVSVKISRASRDMPAERPFRQMM